MIFILKDQQKMKRFFFNIIKNSFLSLNLTILIDNITGLILLSSIIKFILETIIFYKIYFHASFSLFIGIR